MRTEPGPAALRRACQCGGGAVGHAARAALHLAEDHLLTAADLMAAQFPIPPRVALLACSSGGDYRFDEATGLPRR